MSTMGRIDETSGTQVNTQNLQSQERWQTILQYKQIFMENGATDPRTNPYLNKEVADSWIRSREKGVNPYSVATSSNINQERFARILEEQHQLIEITNRLLQSFGELIFSSGYILYLLDKSGVILLHEGEWGDCTPFSGQNSRKGIVADEDTEGTTAHELCIRLKRPVQLIGPEHYCEAFHSIVASAAPIQDDKGEVQAALVILSPLDNNKIEGNLKNLCLHSLALITSMAMAIETQLKLKKATNDYCNANEKAEAFNTNLQLAKNELVTVHNTLNATLALVDDGFVTIDPSGKIIGINHEGIRILKLRPEDIGNKNVGEFLADDSHIIDLAQKGESITVEETLFIGNDKHLYQINIKPIFDQQNKKLESAVLKLNSSEKIAAQLNSRTGGTASYTFEEIIGESRELKNAIDLASRFARSPENVLLIGESGTGKELFAQAIHNIHCPNGPFMAVNCAAMPRELIESELFGYEGGSFTGAERSGRPGKIELAHGGTLFLDEIGDMPLELQAVLLRTLEDKQVMRIGGRRYKKVDFRLIAATNKDLYRMVKDGQFREDLYFRLTVLYIQIPPLRERKNDAAILSQYFIKNYCRKLGWNVPEISPSVVNKINEYQWPGNVRQLQNAMIYAVNTANGGIIKLEHLPNYILIDTSPLQVNQITSSSGKVIGEMLCLENLEKAAIETALMHANNCVPDAAEILGISRSTLYRKLKDFGIEH